MSVLALCQSMYFETIDLVYVMRVMATGFLLLCAVLSIRLITLYKEGLLEEPWLPIFLGVIFLAFSQPLWSEVSPFANSDVFAVFRSGLVLAGSLCLFLGLYRALRVWRRFHHMAAVVLSVRDKEDTERRIPKHTHRSLTTANFRQPLSTNLNS